MRTAGRRILRFVLPLGAGVMLLLFLGACGGEGWNGNGEEGASSGVTGGRITEPSSDGILELLPVSMDDVFSVDVREASEILEGHEDVRREFIEVWDRLELSGGFGIDITDLDYLALGDYHGGDTDLLLLRGLDVGGLKDALEDLGFEKVKRRDVEVWVEGEDSDNDTYWEIFAVLGNTVIAIAPSSSEEVPAIVDDTLARLAGDYEALVDILGPLEGGEDAVRDDVLPRLSGKPELTASFLRLLGEKTGSMNGSVVFRVVVDDGATHRDAGLFKRFELEVGEEIGVDKYDVENALSDGYVIEAFSQWVAEEEDVMEAILLWVAGDQEATTEVSRQLQNRRAASSRDRVSAFWAALPQGAGKYMGSCWDYNCGLQGLSVSKATGGDFHRMELFEFSSAERAEAGLEELVDDWKDVDFSQDSCDAPTFESDGPRISASAVCRLQAMPDFLELDDYD